MRGKDSPQRVIDSYKRRQQTMPFVVGGLAVLLVVIGIIILVVWFTGDSRPSIALFASPTPTQTSTFTPTATVPSPTASATATVSLTPTLTITPTPSGPFEYEVKEGDTCWDIAITFNVDMAVLQALNNFAADACPITPGQKILIPAPDQSLPTATALPLDIPAGTKIEYTVQLGDSLGFIATKFNTTTEAIIAIKENNLGESTALQAGQKLIIPVNLVTPVPTRTPTPEGTPAPPVITAPPTAAPSATP